MNDAKKTERITFYLTPTDAKMFRHVVAFFGGSTSQVVMMMCGIILKSIFDYRAKYGDFS